MQAANAGSASPGNLLAAQSTGSDAASAAQPGQDQMQQMIGQIMMTMMSLMLQMMQSMFGAGPAGDSAASPDPGVPNSSPSGGVAVSVPAPSGNPASPATDTTSSTSNNPSSSGATRTGPGLRPNQMTAGFSMPESSCGPAAAMAFARAMGRDPSVQEVEQKAFQHGFSEAGMGEDGVVALSQDLGAPAHAEAGKIDWDKVKSQLQQGKPVIVHMEGHYFVAEGYDPQTGRIDFGTSASQFANDPTDANGNKRSQYTVDEFYNQLLPALAGAGIQATDRGAIYLDA